MYGSAVFFYFNMISRISSKETEVNLSFCVIQKFLQQTSKFPIIHSDVQCERYNERKYKLPQSMRKSMFLFGTVVLVL